MARIIRSVCPRFLWEISICVFGCSSRPDYSELDIEEPFPDPGLDIPA